MSAHYGAREMHIIIHPRLQKYIKNFGGTIWDPTAMLERNLILSRVWKLLRQLALSRHTQPFIYEYNHWFVPNILTYNTNRWYYRPGSAGDPQKRTSKFKRTMLFMLHYTYHALTTLYWEYWTRYRTQRISSLVHGPTGTVRCLQHSLKTSPLPLCQGLRGQGQVRNGAVSCGTRSTRLRCIDKPSMTGRLLGLLRFGSRTHLDCKRIGSRFFSELLPQNHRLPMHR